MSNDNVIEINERDTITDPLTELLKTGAQKLIHQVVQAELSDFMKVY